MQILTSNITHGNLFQAVEELQLYNLFNLLEAMWTMMIFNSTVTT